MVEIRQQKARQCVTTRSDSEWPTYLGHDLPVSRARLSCLLWLARSPTVQRPCCTLWILPDHLLPTPLLLSSPLLCLPTYPQPQPPCAAYADPRYDTTPLLPVPPNRAGAVRNVPSTHPPPQPYTVPLINLLGRTDRRLAVTSTCRYSEHRVSRISSRPHTTQIAYICDCDAPVGPIPPPTPPCYTPCRAVPAAPPVLLSADPLVFPRIVYLHPRVATPAYTLDSRLPTHRAESPYALLLRPGDCCSTALRPAAQTRDFVEPDRSTYRATRALVAHA